VEDVRDAVVGRLNEGAKVRAEAAGEEQAGLVDREVVVVRKVRGDRLRRALRRRGEGGLDNRRQWNAVWGRARRVAARLEVAPERRELRPETADVAHLAGLAGLGCEGGKRPGGRGAETQAKRDQKKPG
jgi:hypothetical protein